MEPTCTQHTHPPPTSTPLNPQTPQDPRVKGLALLDPVDSSSMGPQGPGFPSSLPPLRATAAARKLPMLAVGAGANGDVVEPAANWRNFVGAAAGGGAAVWEVVLTSCGHLQFLDKQMGLFSLFSGSGETRDEDVRAATHSALAAWAQLEFLPAAGRGGGGGGDALAREAAALARIAAVRCQQFNMGVGGGGDGGGGGGGGAGSGWAAAGAPQAPRQEQQGWPAGGGGAAGAGGRLLEYSFDDLMAMRAKDLKGILLDAGVDSRGLFEKRELAERVYEACCRRR
ncbi:MAG: hypothetical protein J3K34DRAFT_273396 [Monoraphidium minutum]|nr:MAG: hypothetical protein J3K34DRAFT_273396 [Monoraphidium minutum]